MASLGHLRSVNYRQFNTSRFRPLKQPLGIRSQPISCVQPQDIALKGKTLRDQRLHTATAPRSIRPTSTAVVRDSYSGERVRISVSANTPRLVLRFANHIDEVRSKTLKDDIVNQSIIDFHAPRINQHLISIREYQDDREITRLHLERIKVILAKLPADKAKWSWKAVSIPALLWVCKHIRMGVESGDMEVHWKSYGVMLEKFAFNARIQLDASFDCDWESRYDIDPSSCFLDRLNTFVTRREMAAAARKEMEAAADEDVIMQDVDDLSAGLDISNGSVGCMSTNTTQTSSSGVTNNASITGQTNIVFAQPPPSSNEPVDSGSATTAYRRDAILASSEDDILHSKGAYHLSLITDLFDIKNLFTHNSFSKIVANQKAHLVNLLDNKCQIKPEDVRFLRTACDYITESARQSWWSWKHLADCSGLGLFRNDMFYWQQDYLSNLPDIDEYREARLLGIEIEKMDKRMDGEHEATGATRAVKPLKTHVSGA